VTPKENKPEEVDGKLVMDRFPVPISLDKCAFVRIEETVTSLCVPQFAWGKLFGLGILRKLSY